MARRRRRKRSRARAEKMATHDTRATAIGLAPDRAKICDATLNFDLKTMLHQQTVLHQRARAHGFGVFWNVSRYGSRRVFLLSWLWRVSN